MDLYLASVSFLLSFILVIVTIPPILRTAQAKNLFDHVNERKIHIHVVPPLGGVAIFIAFTLTSIVATDGYSFDSLKYIIASVILIFFIGLKDDLMDISAKKKFIVQVFATVVLVLLGNIVFTDLHGVLFLHKIESIPAIFISIFLLLAIINAYNLIDGIDGLASGLGIISSLFFGIWFFINHQIQFSILSFALTGSLLAFFIFNVFGKKYKMFMGDTGSLILGLILSVLVVKFNEFNLDSNIPWHIKSSPAVSFVLVIVPLIDTFMVMIIRIARGRSPFSADRNHIHHKLLYFFPKHLTVTLIIIFTNIVLLLFSLILNETSININFQLLILLITGFLLAGIPSLLVKRFTKEKQLATQPN